MMPLCRSCCSAPTISVALPNLFGWNCEASDHQDLALAHRHVHRAEIEERMSEASTRLPSL